MTDQDLLDQSRLYTFIDQEKRFALYFLEGQALIRDIVLTQNLRPAEFPYFRAMVLSVQLMLGFLKPGENFCFYIDSESPYFRLKIEMNDQGLMRGMIYSDGLDDAPETISGKLRMLKFLPSSEMPYQSIIELESAPAADIINLMLSRSYQVNSRIYISEESDQSLMLYQLPLTEKEEPSDLNIALTRYGGALNEIMKQALTGKAAVISGMEKYGFRYLASKPVRFACGCSKEQMIENLKIYARSSSEALFAPGEDVIEVVCEYCKTAYPITRREVEKSPSDYQ